MQGQNGAHSQPAVTDRVSHRYHHPYELSDIDDTAQDNLRTEQSSQLSAAANGEPQPYQHVAGRPGIELNDDRSPTPLEQHKRQQHASAQTSPEHGGHAELVLGLPPGVEAAEHRSGDRAVTFLLDDTKGEGDTVRVRELPLGNGQKATIIMEDGRIKRIVTTNGQVAEVRWQNSAPRPNSNEGRLPLTVNFTSPALRQRASIDHVPAASMPALPKSMGQPAPIDRPASAGHVPMTPSSRRAALQTAPSSFGRDSRNRRAQSMSDVRWDGGRSVSPAHPARQGSSRVKSLQTAPMRSTSGQELLEDDPQGDMPTILETNSQVPKNWNPVTTNWLPREMTAAAARPPSGNQTRTMSAARPSSQTVVPERPGTAPSAARKAASLNSRTSLQPPAGELPLSRQHSAHSAGRSTKSSSQRQVVPSPGGSSRRHSVEGDAISKRPGWWKRLKLAVFPTMNLRKGKDDKPLSVDHATPTARAASQKFAREEVVKRGGSSSRSRAQSRREGLSSGWVPAAPEHDGQPIRATLSQGRAGSPTAPAHDWRQPHDEHRREYSAPPAAHYPPAEHRTSRLSRDRPAFEMEQAAEDEWENEPAPPAPVRHGSPYARRSGDRRRGSHHFVQEPVRRSLDLQQQHQRQHEHEREHEQQLDEPQLAAGRNLPVTPTHGADEAELLPRRAVSQRPVESGSRYDSLQSVVPGAISWMEKPDQEEKQRPSLLQADDSALETEGAHRRRERRRRERLSQEQAPVGPLVPSPKLQTGMAGKWRKNMAEGSSGAQVDELLQMSSLQRLAREKISELEIVEAGSTLEIIWHICLNNGASRISKAEKYDKTGEVVEGPRRDGRPGILRSQLTITPEGHVHIRSLQNEPFAAVFHDRFKLSTGARRIKFDQKFQLLAPGVLPIKHYSIWHRVNEE